mmetsp:Transcript_29520/g.57925  ORF Transcript_29520/g.57925 Transcript_29520/m.57925 type:complete len:599 (+) Transcript_29520:139-1935(+)
MALAVAMKGPWRGTGAAPPLPVAPLPSSVDDKWLSAKMDNHIRVPGESAPTVAAATFEGSTHGGCSCSHPPPSKRSAMLLAAASVFVSFRISGRRSRCNRSQTALAATGTRKSRVKISQDIPKGSDFYKVLGVNRNASMEDIRTAYKHIIRTTHPDVNPNPEATNLFIQAQEAFRWLSDPQQREVYDGVGELFGQDAIYDYTDEPILGSLTKIREIEYLRAASDCVNLCLKQMTWKTSPKVDITIKDIRKRFRKLGAQRVIFVRDFFVRHLREVLQYPKLIRQLHPFERLTVELALMQHAEQGGAPIGQLLAVVRSLRKRINEEAAAAAHAVSKAERGRLATFLSDKVIQDIWDLMLDHEPIFVQFRAAQTAMFKVPCIDLDKPTVVFVGGPNVGKSSLVRSVSTGKPEVSDYIFTTKQLTIGHLWHFIAGTPLLIHGQVVDSPGLRGPPGGDYNLLDELTLGSMQHLPTGVVYVFDPDPWTHGYLTVEDQIEVREALRQKFPRRPWLDVITKVDLCEENGDVKKEVEDLSSRYPEALQVSAYDGTGLDELNTEVRSLLEQMTRIVRQLQRAKIRQLRVGGDSEAYVGKEALITREMA